jgi:Xaa-Pro aminopeptidase
VTSPEAAPTIDEQIERRRAALASQWNLDEEVVLIGAGDPVPIPGRGDPTYPFRSHSEYLYLTDRERPGGVLTFDPQDGWVDFVAPVTRDELLWERRTPPSIDDGVPVSKLEPWLEARSGRRLVNLGASVPGVSPDAALASELRGPLNHLRRQKDPVELGRMRRAEEATRAGFALVAQLFEPGVSERALQIELEAEFFRGGADALAFDTIIAAGPSAAVLHHPPTAQPLADGELVLIDAGGEYRGYASDVTRTYPVSGSFTGVQADIYALVKEASRAAIDRCGAGTEFRDVHVAAALTIGAGLVDLGLLRGEPEALVGRGTVSLFFPHGVGHMVGLGVRDAGEVLPGREPDADAFPRLRVDLPLLPGHVVTVEPGIYFVPALLKDPEMRERHRDAVRWEQAEALLEFGGIRLEENVLITDDGVEVLTSDIPLVDGPG